MTVVCRLKESSNVERWLAVPSVGFWRNYCFFLIWRRDFSARSQGQVADMCTSVWACSACLYNRFPVRMCIHVEGHIQENTSSCDCSRLLCGHLEYDSTIFIGTKDFPTQFAEKKIKHSCYVDYISPHVCEFSKTLKCCFRSTETLGPNSITFFVGGLSYRRQIFYPVCNISKVNCHQL